MPTRTAQAEKSRSQGKNQFTTVLVNADAPDTVYLLIENNSTGRTEQYALTHAEWNKLVTQPVPVEPLHVRVMTNDGGMQVVADLPNWPYPLPSVGDYLFHPPLTPGEDSTNIAGHVKTVTWRTHDRPAEPIGQFVMTAHPYVEIVI